jgi:hypothetical protein
MNYSIERMKLSHFKLVLFVWFVGTQLSAQTYIFPDYVYQPNIRFPEVYKVGSDQTNNIIELNSNQKLIFQFDDWDNDLKNYSYQVIHCNPDWSVSDLIHMQYMQGFESYNITESHFSQNVTQLYTHWKFTFPNEFMHPTMSGNFIMKVFDTNDPEKIYFTRRFMVVESVLSFTEAKIRYSSRVDLRNTHQELYFTINTENIVVQDYVNDFKVNIIQNNRWDNAIFGLTPQYNYSTEVKFNYTNGESSFTAGNQWRYIDIKTIQLITEPIVDIKIEKGKYHIRIRDEVLRNYRNYQNRPDINGRYTVYNQDGFTTAIDPDYATLYFTLPNNETYKGKDVYMIGGFTYGQMLDQYKMNYDEYRDVYWLAMPFKQGYYNYMYTVKDNKTNKGDVTPIEGSYAECENDYTIMAYVRRPGDITHKLVGVKYLNSLVDR